MSRRRRPGHRGGRPSRGSARYQARLGNVVYEFAIDGRARNRVTRMLEGAVAARAFFALTLARAKMATIWSRQDSVNEEVAQCS